MQISVENESRSQTERRNLHRVAVRAIRAGGVTSLAGTVAYLAILITTATFASTGNDAAIIRSVLLPCTLLCAGLSMMFSVPAQIGGASGNKYPGGGTLRGWLSSVSWIAFSFGILFVAMRLCLTFLDDVLFGNMEDSDSAGRFLSAMVLCYLFVGVADFTEAHLRGRGLFIVASSLVASRALLIAGGYLVAVHLVGLSPMILPYLYALGSIVTLAIGLTFVLREARNVRLSDREPKVNTRRLTIRVGLPVFVSYLLLSFVVSAQILAVEQGLGQAAQIAFSSMLFVQTLCVVAATGVAAGASSIVVAEKTDQDFTRSQVGHLVARIANYIAGIQLLIFFVFLVFGRWFLPWILVGTEPIDPFVFGSQMMFAAALLTANSVMIVTMLEELGFGAFGLLLNLSYFVLLITVTFFLATAIGTFTGIGLGLVALSLLACVGLRLILPRLPKGTLL